MKNVYVISEIGINHNGSMKLAKELIDLSKNSGANAVKFQKRTVELVYTKEELDKYRESPWGTTNREQKVGLELSIEQYIELEKYAKNLGLEFIVSCWDLASIDLVEQHLDLAYHKVASALATNKEFLKKLNLTGRPVILSTGMCEIAEMKVAFDILEKAPGGYAVMHCVSSYPTPDEQCNLRMINNINSMVDVPVGYSGHEIGYLPTLTAVARGAKLVERHFTLDKTMEGFDHKISREPEELEAMVKDIRRVRSMLGDGQKMVTSTEQLTRDKYHVSMVSLRPILEGEMINSDMVTYRNPGTGIPYKSRDLILGRLATHDIAENVLLHQSDVS